MSDLKWKPIEDLPHTTEWSSDLAFRDSEGKIYEGNYVDWRGERILSPTWLWDVDIIEASQIGR